MEDNKKSNPFSKTIEEINALNKTLNLTDKIIGAMVENQQSTPITNPTIRFSLWIKHENISYELILSDENQKSDFLDFIRKQNERAFDKLTELLGGN